MLLFCLLAIRLLGQAETAISPQNRDDYLRNVTGRQNENGCLESSQGKEYTGTISVTENGEPCARWDQKNTKWKGYMFPEQDRSRAENYCRNPSSSEKPWCYTETDWDWCDIPLCTPAPVIDGFEGYTNIHITGLNIYEIKEISVAECADKCLNYWIAYNKYSCASFDYDMAKRTCYFSHRNFETIYLPDSVVFREGVYHYERLNVGICDVDTSWDRQCLWTYASDLNFEKTCQQMGCCNIGWYGCYMSKTQMPTELLCDDNCKEMITTVASKFQDPSGFNSDFISASLAEAKSFLPDIPQSFWDWLTKQHLIAEAITAVKWPIEPQLMENLYELVSGFGEEKAEKYPHIFVGVSYATMQYGVRNRLETDLYYRLESMIDSDDLKAEGLSETEIKIIREQEDEVAKAALQITEEEMKKEYEQQAGHIHFCKNPQDWVLIAGSGEHMDLECLDVTQKEDVSLEECKKRACYYRGNGITYNGELKMCFIRHCHKGTLLFDATRPGNVELWILKKGHSESPLMNRLPVESLNVQSMPETKEATTITETAFAEFKNISVDACETKCKERLACASFVHHTSSETCHLYHKILELQKLDTLVYSQKAKSTDFLTCKNHPINTTAGDPCVFPFIYKGEKYIECIDVDTNYLWCATTSNYDEDGKWSKCITETTDGDIGDGVCKFPFSHGAQWYSDCYSENTKSRAWCMDESRKWGYCRKGQVVCSFTADEDLKFELLHQASENKYSECVLDVKNTTAQDLDECFTQAYTNKANLVQFKPGSCNIRLCYTKHLAIAESTNQTGYAIYRDYSMVFDEGTPPSWEKEFTSYQHANIWSDFANSWAKRCNVESPTKLPFPPRESKMNGFDLVQFLLNHNYDYTNFPTLTAPWPLVVFMLPWASKRECEYIWSVLYKGAQPLYYSHYDSAYPEKYCEPRAWFPVRTIPRIIADGGVCGRQSTLEEYTKTCMGIPALGMAQPAHRALFYYAYDKSKMSAKDKTAGPYRLILGQQVSDSTFNCYSFEYVRTAFKPTGLTELSRREALEYYRGIPPSLNNGYQNFIKAHVAMALDNRAPPEQKEITQQLLVDALELNPHLSYLWHYYLRQISGFYEQWYENFATSCPSGNIYENLFSKVWDLAKLNLREVVIRENKEVKQMDGFAETYLAVILQHYAPAPCCVDVNKAPTIIHNLQSESQNAANYFTNSEENTYLKKVIEMNIALCKAYAGQDWSDILSLLTPTSHEMMIEELMEIKDLLSFIDSRIIPLKVKTDVDKKALADHIKEEILSKIPQILVKNGTWILTQDYSQLSKYVQQIYEDIGDESGRVELSEHDKDLLDMAHGPNKTWWEAMVNKNLVSGDYDAILDGSLVWNEDQQKFLPADTSSENTSRTSLTQRKKESRSPEELEAIEAELREENYI